MNSFENFTIEDIHQCAGDEFPGGIRSRIYYAPVAYFDKLELPGDEDEFLITEEKLKFKLMKGWAFIDCLIDEGEIKLLTSGSIGRLKIVSSLTVFLLGLNDNALRIIESLLNIDLVFLIIDSNGKQWILGNLRNPARIENAEGSSGKKYEDNAGFSITINCKSILYPVSGDSTQLYVNKDWLWVLSSGQQPILFNNDTPIQIEKI